jgi:hypothetical protein
VFDCYEDFRFKINAQRYFTEENFSSRGLKPDDLFDTQTAGEILNHPPLARLRHLANTS